MKRRTFRPIQALATFTALLVFALTTTSASAAIHIIDISPLGTDYAVGLAEPNASSPNGSGATGNEKGAGILYDDVAKILSFDFAYGSVFGFIDLAGAYTTAHIHGPISVAFPGVGPNPPADVVHGLDPFHADAGAVSGSFVGLLGPLSAAEEGDLLSSLWYINIHSTHEGSGEIRGQLVPVGVIPLPAAFWLLLAPLVGMVGLRRSTA